MHIKIAYYSGSGNTQYVALLLRRFLSSKHKVSTFFIKKNKRMDDTFDALLVGTPVYAYDPPDIVIDFIKTLRGNGRKAFIFITKGLLSGNTGHKIAYFLKKSGFKVVGSKDILMADSLFILLSKEGSLLHKIMLIPNIGIKNRVKKLSFTIENAFLSNKEITPSKKLYTPITSFIAHMFWKKEKKWQQAFFSDERCDLCGACVGLCPENNIKIEKGRVLWGYDCDFCLRCLHRCPQKAIQIGRFTKSSPRYHGPGL